jgi:hypothetical protein
MQKNNQKMVKGFMFEQMVAFLQAKKGEVAVSELEKCMGS